MKRVRSWWRRVISKPDRTQPVRASEDVPGLPHPTPARRRRALRISAIIVGSVAVAILFVAVFVTGNMVRGPVSSFLSAKLGRDVQIVGDLHMNLLSFNPTATAQGIFVANPDWVEDGGDMAQIDYLYVKTRLFPLLVGNLIFTELRADRPKVELMREPDGRANWHFGSDDDEPTELPPITLFVINDGRLQINDRKRRLTFDGTISSREDATAKDSGFYLTGRGRLNNSAFVAEIRGGPLINVDVTKPYRFNADVRAGASRIEATGAIDKPFDLGSFHAAVLFSGANMADLYYLTGLALPGTPPYRLSGTLRRNADVYRFERFSGRVGDSDLSGTLNVDAGGERTMLTGDIASKVLDFDDLGPLIGAPPAVGGGETASAPQVAEARTMTAETRLLPNVPLDIERVRQMDARVNYTAQEVRSEDFPLRRMTLKVVLDNGVLKLQPVTFTFARGTLTGDVSINARGKVPATDIDVRLSDLRLEQFFPTAAGEPPALQGTAVARAKLRGSGNSIRKAAASADGEFTLVLPKGEIRQSFAELLGINVSSALGLLLTGDKSQTELRCGVAHFEAKDGILALHQFVFDTSVVTTSGEGTVSLRDEQVDLTLTGHPKEARLIRLRAPITLTGSLASPAIGIKPGTAIVQGGIAAGLATLFSPLAAILPFVDPGLAKDANCASLIAQAKKEGAPVRPAQIPQEPKTKS